MRVIQRVGHGGDDFEDVGFRQPRRVLAQQLRGVGALHVVHRNPQLPFVFAAVVDTDDVLVVQAGGEIGLPVEALPKLEVVGELGGQDLQGVTARQPRMLRQIHLAHPAGPQPPDDPESSEQRAFG